MPSIFTTLGRLAGKASRSRFLSTVADATKEAAHEASRAANRTVSLAMLRRKRQSHLALLGRTVYRLHHHGIDPLTDAHTDVICRVLAEIDGDIAAIEAERAPRPPSSPSHPASDTSR